MINTEQHIIFLILIVTLVLFAWGRMRHDIVAMLSLLACVMTGLVPPVNAFSGFGHPAVITVAAVLIISHALKNSGFVDSVADKLSAYTGSQFVHIGLLTLVVTVASAFMNNVGALALLLPVALATAAQQNRSPALLLMPLAFGSILGGMTTMIGTPPNIIIATFREDLAGVPFGMFDFTWVGLPVALMGVFFVTLAGWRLIPQERLKKNPPQQLFEIGDYLSEVKVPAKNNLVGKTIDEAETLSGGDLTIIGLVRGKAERAQAVQSHQILEKNDILLVQSDPNELAAVIEKLGLELVTTATPTFESLAAKSLKLSEGIITRGSSLEGRGIQYLRRRTGSTVALVSIARQGSTVRKRLRSQVFKTGDILLLQGDADTLDEQMADLGLLPLVKRQLSLGRDRRILLAILTFVAAIMLGAFNVVPIIISFMLAILVYLLTGIITTRELYREIDWPVIVLLGAMIPVGQALQTTGASVWLATEMVGITEGLGPIWIMAAILVITMFLSDIINNAATALVMAPIAVSVSGILGVNVDPMLMAVAVGASCAFLTPIGHQSNLLVMGPGGYHFTDYWRMGLPLEIMIVVIAVPLIPLVWSF